MRQSQSESAAIASSSSNASQSNRAKGAEAVQLGPVSEEEHRRMSKASTATGGADEPVIGGGTEMGEAIMEMVRPAVERLDEQVKNTRKSQLLLATHIEQLSTRLKGIVDDQILPYDLDVYVRKLEDSRKRVSNVNQRLQALHGRMSQLQRNIARETYKQRQQPPQQQHAPQ